MEFALLFAIILILLSIITRFYSAYRVFTGRRKLRFKIGY